MIRRFVLVLLVAVLLAPALSAQTRTARTSFPGSDTGRAIVERHDVAVTVTAASGNNTALDAEDFQWCVFGMDLTALSGGVAPTVQLIVQTSPDNSTFYTVTSLTALSAVGQSLDATARGYFRYVRARWVTTGGPSTATATFIVQCKRGG